MKRKTTGYILITLVFLAMLLAINLINASDVQSLGKIKQNDSILLKQNCVNVTYTNITSINVNGKTTKELITSPISMNLISNGYQTYRFNNTFLEGEYIVTGICDENGIVKAWSYNFYTTPSGTTISPVQISIYIFFLLICLFITFFSVRLFQKNKFSKDKINDKELYETKRKNEFLYYMKLLKEKLWIVGIFGVYLSILLFLALLNQLVYDIGLTSLDVVLRSTVVVLAWMLIPFTVFWFVFILLEFYQTTKKIFKYQFGSFK